MSGKHIVDSSELRQGDIVEVEIGEVGKEVGLVSSPSRVAILSQTCDVIQKSKQYCLVAPVIVLNQTDYQSVLKGRFPLLVFLWGDASGSYLSADIGKAFSLSKERLMGASLMARPTLFDQDKESRRIRAAMARAFSRFPFPDDVHPVLEKVQKRLRSKAGKSGNFSKVIDLIDTLRIEADYWDDPHRSMTLYVIVPSEELIPVDDVDPTWHWGDIQVNDPENMSLDDICRLILQYRSKKEEQNSTTLFHLWKEFGNKIESSMITPFIAKDSMSLGVEVVSDEEFTLRDFRRTESLDLDTISESGVRAA